MRKLHMLWLAGLASLSGFSHAEGLSVKITPQIDYIEIPYQGKTIRVQRNQDNNAVIQGDFAKTSRNCPPFCTQPMKVADGIDTIGERELVLFMANELKDGSGLLIDARTPRWYQQGTIPGSINIPYTHMSKSSGADEFVIEDALKRFGAERDEKGQWDFFDAKTLVLWCNGPWCGQSPTAILGLLDLGYPAEKLRYYRGGMQLWQIMGLTVVKPE